MCHEELADLTAFRAVADGRIAPHRSRRTRGHDRAVAVLRRLLLDYPEINVALSIDSSLTDVVSGRFGAGVRPGEATAKDMVAVRIGPGLHMVIIGSPNEFANDPAPQTAQDLANHRRITLRLSACGGFCAWEPEQNGREVRVRVEGPLAFNNVAMILRAGRLPASAQFCASCCGRRWTARRSVRSRPLAHSACNGNIAFSSVAVRLHLNLG